MNDREGNPIKYFEFCRGCGDHFQADGRIFSTHCTSCKRKRFGPPPDWVRRALMHDFKEKLEVPPK